jgi:hypothetical protein
MKKRALMTKEEERELANTKKLESIMARSELKRDIALSKIEKESIISECHSSFKFLNSLKALRKTAKQRENIEGLKIKRDIILDYVDRGSRVSIGGSYPLKESCRYMHP